MSTIHVVRDIHDIARAPRCVGKDFVVDRDLVTQPITAGEVLQLGLGFEADLVVTSVTPTGMTPTVVTVAPLAQVGLDVPAKIAEVVSLGWVVER